jgi:hypothetical protein
MGQKSLHRGPSPSLRVTLVTLPFNPPFSRWEDSAIRGANPPLENPNYRFRSYASFNRDVSITLETCIWGCVQFEYRLGHWPSWCVSCFFSVLPGKNLDSFSIRPLPRPSRSSVKSWYRSTLYSPGGDSGRKCHLTTQTAYCAHDAGNFRTNIQLIVRNMQRIFKIDGRIHPVAMGRLFSTGW